MTISLSRRSLIGGMGVSVAASAAIGGSMRNLLIRAPESITITDRGASLSGLRAATRDLAHKGGGIIRLQARKMIIDTAELVANGSVALPPNTTIEGDGASFAFVGEAIAPPLFLGRDVSQVALRNIVAIGNGKAITDTVSGTFALFELSKNANADVEDLRIDNLELSGFKGERWIQFLQRNPNRRMSGLRIADLQAKGGASPARAIIGVASAPLWIYGINGEIDDVAVQRLTVDAHHLKSGVGLFHKVRRVAITDAAIKNAGILGAADNAGAYAILAYGAAGEMSDVSIVSPVIRRPRSCGIYMVGCQRARVVGAEISGQTDKVDTSLPKGAIALNGCSDVTIEDCHLHDNAVDLSVASGRVNSLDLNVRRMTSGGSETSVLLKLSPGKNPVSGVVFEDCTLSGKSRVLRVLNEQVPGRCYNNVSISGGTFRSETAVHVLEFTQGQITEATGYRVENATVQGNGVAIMASGLQGTLQIRNTTIEGLGKLACGIAADDCPKIDWSGITFRNMPSGYAYRARSLRHSARGSLRDLRFLGVATPMAKGSVGNIS